MAAQTLKKHEIIRGPSAYDEIFQKGKKIRGRLITLFYVSSESTQMGIAVSRKYKKAVERNRVKRYIREIFRQNKAWFEKKKLFFMCAKQRNCPHFGVYIMKFQI
ncbi:MAG: ribonuclease P protein component [Calditrichaeota bacterium]|nr:ribonuclease P protein component [Calditrichota bacterium]